MAAIPLQRLRGSFPTAGFFHSDIAFLPALFRDVAGGGSLSSWALPEAPYFLPDWPLYFVAWWVTPTYSSAVAVFALFQIALLAAAWLAVVRYLSPQPLTSGLLGLALLVGAALAGQVPADYASVSFAHFGTFILALAGLAVLLRLHLGRPPSPVGRATTTDPVATDRGPIEAGRQGALLLTMFVIVAASTASDLLFLFWFVGPVVAIEALLITHRLAPALVRRRAQLPDRLAGSARIAAITAAGAGTGVLVHSLVARPSGNYQPAVRTDVALATRSELLLDVFTQSELTAYWPYYSLACLVAGLALAGFWWRRRSEPSWFLFGLWFVFATVAALFAEFLTAGPSWRFHQFVYHVPILMAGVWLPAALSRLRLPVVPIAVAGSVVVVAAGTLPVDELSIEHVPAEVDCLDRALEASGSRVGVGNYAVSRLAVVYSAFELDVGARNTWMAPEEDVHSRAWARSSADFAILRPTIFGAIPERTLRSLAERAPVEVSCGQWRVLDFGPNGLDLDRLADGGGRAETPGCWYTNSIGVPDPLPEAGGPVVSCSLRVDPGETDPEIGSYVGFGSYYAVEPGRYRLGVDLGPGPVPDGTFEVAVWDANSGELQAVEASSLAEPEIVLDAPAQDRELSLEGRILYRGGAPLVLERLVIERID